MRRPSRELVEACDDLAESRCSAEDTIKKMLKLNPKLRGLRNRDGLTLNDALRKNTHNKDVILDIYYEFTKIAMFGVDGADSVDL
jgi:hypothetical protein